MANLNNESEANYLLTLGYIEKSRYAKMSALAFSTVFRTTEQKTTSPPTCGSYVTYVNDPKSN